MPEWDENINRLLKQLETEGPVEDVLEISKNDNFVFHLLGSKRLSMMVKDVSLPSVSLGEASVPVRFKSVYRPGDIDYGEFSATFFMDARFDNYFFIKEWMEELSGIEDYDPSLMDGVLILYDNESVVRHSILFRGMLPTSLGGSSLSSSGEMIKMTFDVSFRFQEMVSIPSSFE